jgi:pilus assembly protein CpaB
MKQQARMIVAGVAGLMLVLFIYMMMTMKPKQQTAAIVDTKLPTTAVLVAKRDISLGEVTSPDSFRWQEWPEGGVNPAYVTQSRRPNAIRDYDKRIARSPLLAGEPITDTKLIKHEAGGVMSAILPAGMRAISTKIREETAAGRLILPNDYVDVILTQRRRGRGAGGGEEAVADTLFRNVRVLAIGQLIEVKEGAKRSADGATATLELSPRQAEILALANTMGDLTLALRSVADIGGETTSRDNRTGNSIRVLRYGVKSRAYGVN